MSNKRNKNRKAFQKKRATSKCERRNATKRLEKQLREQRQREYIEQQMKLAEERAEAQKKAANTEVTVDENGEVGVATAETEEVQETATEAASDIDLSLRWHIVDKDSGDVVDTATSRAKAQAASKELASNTKVVDSQK